MGIYINLKNDIYNKLVDIKKNTRCKSFTAAVELLINNYKKK